MNLEKKRQSRGNQKKKKGCYFTERREKGILCERNSTGDGGRCIKGKGNK